MLMKNTDMPLLQSIADEGLIAGYLLLQLQCSFCHEYGDWRHLYKSVRQVSQLTWLEAGAAAAEACSLLTFLKVKLE